VKVNLCEGELVCSGNCEIMNVSPGPMEFDLLGTHIQTRNWYGNTKDAMRICISTNRGQSVVSDFVCDLVNP
jgi:hypothetical protein